MRFTILFAALAAASAVFAGTLADKIGTVPAFLQLQQQHFHGTLSVDERAEFVQLAKTLHSKNGKTLKQLTGTSSDAEQLVKNLLAGALQPLKDVEAQIKAEAGKLASRANDDELAEGEIFPNEKEIGHVPTFILLNEAASKPDAKLEDAEALIKQGLVMLTNGYSLGSLKTMLGTDTPGVDLLNKIIKAHKAHQPAKARNVKPAFPQARRAQLGQRRAL